MAEPYQRQRALDYRALDAVPRDSALRGPSMQMWVEASSGQLCLRGNADSRFAALVESVWGTPLPVIANTVSGDYHGDDDSDGQGLGQGKSKSKRQILWLGPDEWLAVCADDELHSLREALHEALIDEHALISDVSHSRVVIALHGEHARDVLCKGCSLDLDPVAFKAGDCAQTSLARAHMLLHQVSDTPRYHVYAHRSFAGYVYDWLQDAAREYMRP
jgi:sarcosine oxidase subunit gamma